MAKQQQITATLVRGQNYVLILDGGGRSKEFKKGVPVAVTEDEKAILERDAVDTVTLASGDGRLSEARSKFSFASMPVVPEPEPEPVDDGTAADSGDAPEEAPPAPAPRRRRRR